ncbi:hypothetical protein QCA50_018010 [Cerrena zonata]|uniref:FHA domain-containing protein n=1 Tax=Cerrena zonata TaxID=2478898 RepID=A0AAW0FC83_9APHY
MWVITGPFDGSLNTLNTRKTKLLKPGKTYVLGRKDRPLLVNHKSISRDHLSFTVGDYTVEDASNPDKKPSLELRNSGSKPRKVIRGSETIPLNPQSSCELQDGDEAFVLNDAPISVKWESVCCYFPQGASEIPYEGCSKLGISLVVVPHPSVTHHLTPTITLSPQITSSLLTLAHLVRPDWLTTLLTQGIAPYVTQDTQLDEPSPPERPSRLEANFTLPRLSDYKPDFSPAIPSSMRSMKIWEPDESRLNFFSGKRFIFVGEKGREVSLDLREVVKRGGAEYECYAVEGGRSGLHAVLAKGQGKGKPLVLVADEHAMGIAVGQEQWMDIVKEAAEYELLFIRPEKITQAVMHIDLSYVDCTLKERVDDSNRFASPIPDVIPNTHPDEPSLPLTQAPPRTITPPPAPSPSRPPTRKRRRVVQQNSSDDENSQAAKSITPSGAVSQTFAESAEYKETSQSQAVEPQPEEKKEEDPPKPARRRPTRRPVAPIRIDEDDDSVIQDGETSAAESIAPPPPPVKPPSSRGPPGRRPKRRPIGETPALDEDYSVDDSTTASVAETPLKRFKALYEESDPDRIAKSGVDEYMNMYKGLDSTGSMTQSESVPIGGSRTQAGLEAVPEEEEEQSTMVRSQNVVGSESQTQTTGSRLKRKTRADNADEDVEMEEAERPRVKRRAVEGVHAVEHTAGTQAEAQTQAETQSKSVKPVSKVFDSRMAVETEKAEKVEKTRKPASKAGAAPGNPDKDEAFLKALASTKRGKKNEDKFDREFNNLKISKPDLRKEEVEKQWDVLEEFGDDGDLRGNFMVVVEMEVPERQSRGTRRYDESRMEWDGRPDFKKFKKKSLTEKRQKVELVLTSADYDDTFDSQPNDDSQSKGNDDLFDMSIAPGRKPPSRSRTTQPIVIDEDDEVVLKPRSKRQSQREPSPVHVQLQPLNPNRRRQQKSKPIEPLFLESDEDIEMRDDDDDYRGASNKGSSGIINLSDDDIDDGTTVPSQETTTRPTRASSRKKTTIRVQEDSDDDVQFKGFGRKRR